MCMKKMICCFMYLQHPYMCESENFVPDTHVHFFRNKVMIVINIISQGDIFQEGPNVLSIMFHPYCTMQNTFFYICMILKQHQEEQCLKIPMSCPNNCGEKDLPREQVKFGAIKVNEFLVRQKGRDLTQSYDKRPYTHRKIQKAS